MEFRPCIDIHNGQVKQIVGGSLKDRGDQATENFVADKGADYYAKLYQKYGIKSYRFTGFHKLSQFCPLLKFPVRYYNKSTK